jgi:N-acetyl-gamma-glutamyl-phosphate reductase
VRAGLIPGRLIRFGVNAVSGYSGGGKGMIAEFEGSEHGRPTAWRTYGLNARAQACAGDDAPRWTLSIAPIFAPSVADTLRGMIVEVPVHLCRAARRALAPGGEG